MVRALKHRRSYLVSAVCLVTSALALAQQPGRDAVTTAAGSAAIVGSVVNDESTPRPVRRALVTLTLSGRGGGGGTTVVTDDAGSFSFNRLPAGRYTLSASRPGFPNASYGASRPGRPGTAIQLADRQQLANIVIRMWRGAVITGTIFDPNGEPLPSARVSLQRYMYSSQNGQRTLQQSGGSATTDDRGVYRIYGVAPGEYFVQLGVPFSLPGDLRQTTEQSVQAALQQGRASGAGAAIPALAKGPAVTYAPIFYPGATSAANATTVKVGAGEERIGIDMQLQLVPTATIEGVVVHPDGTAAPDAQLTVVGTEQAGPMSIMSNVASMFGGNRPKTDGSFSLTGIAPGQYTVVARTGGRGAAGTASNPALWAAAEVSINGQDVNGVRLQLEPGVTVSGRVAFDSSTSPAAGSAAARPPDPSTIRVSLAPILTGSAVAAVIQPGQVDAQGNFSFTNVTPGRYRFSATTGVAGRGSAGAPATAIAGPLPGGIWTIKSATVRGRETLDSGLEVKPGETVGDAVLTFTDRPTTLSGTLFDASGRSASDYFIILYSADKSFWPPPSRRVVMSRPGTDGNFTFRNLPPGDYLLAAATDVDQGEWMDPAFLAQFVNASIKISLVEGETKAQDIRIAGGRH